MLLFIVTIQYNVSYAFRCNRSFLLELPGSTSMNTYLDQTFLTPYRVIT